MPPSTLALHFGRFPDLASALACHIDRRWQAEPDLAARLEAPVELIVPSRAAATAVALALLRLRPAGIAGVEIRTPETLALALLQRTGLYPRVSSAGQQRLAMIGAARRAKEPLRAVDGLAPLLLRSWRDVRDSDLTTEELRQRAGRGGRNLIPQLTDVWQRYEAAIRAAGAVDAVDLLRDASLAIENGSTAIAPQIVFGFYDLTGLQQKLLFAIHRAGALDSFWIPVPLAGEAPAEGYGFAAPLVDSLSRLGRSSGEDPARHEHSGADRSRVRIAAHAAQPREVREVVSELRAMIDAGTPPSSIAIVARSIDDRLAALVAREAAAFGVAVTPRRGRRVVAHPWGRALVDLLRLRRERFHREVIVSLAGAPFRKGVLPDRARATEIDEAARQAEIPGGDAARIRRLIPSLLPWLQEKATLLAETVAALEQMSRGADETKAAGAWADWIERIVDLLRVRVEEDLVAAEAIGALVETLRLPALSEARLDPLELSALIEGLPDLPPAEADEQAVWFGDLMSFRGRSFEHVFAIAMQQEHFPQRRSEDILLPNEVRRQTGVREIADGRAEERLLFELLRDGAAATLRISYSGGDGIRKSWRPSIFVKELALSAARDESERSEIVRAFDAWVGDGRWLEGSPPADDDRRSLSRPDLAAARIISGEERSHLLARQLRLVSMVGTRSVYDGHLTRSPRIETTVGARFLELSPRRIETFGVCPHRFFLESVLKIGDVEEPEWELELSARRRGLVEHKVLERFYRGLDESDYVAMGGEEALLPHLSDRLRDLLEFELDEHERQFPPASAMLRRIERKITLRALERFLVRDMNDLATAGLRPAWYELSFGRTSHDDREPDFPSVALDAGGIEIRIRGRIDRVDMSADRTRIRVVDYKTGKGARHDKLEEKIEEGHALQLALYALAAESIFRVPPEGISGAILPIRSDKESDRFSFELSAIRERLQDHLAVFARAARGGVFPPVPGDDCAWCVVGRWCRTRHTREEARVGRAFVALDYIRHLEEEAR